jgi:hypothetical protein
MNKVHFLGRLAIICNVFYLCALLLRYNFFFKNEFSNTLLLIGGWILSPVFNLAFIFSLLFIKKPGKKLPVKSWIWLCCACMLSFQLIYFLLHSNSGLS